MTSTVSIRPGASRRVEPFDAAHYLPTIRVAIDRVVGYDAEEHDGLGDRTSFELSVDECAALIDRLRGSLRVLMTRGPWFIDRT